MKHRSKQQVHLENQVKKAHSAAENSQLKHENVDEWVLSLAETTVSHPAPVNQQHRYKRTAMEVIIGGGLLAALLTILSTAAYQELRTWYLRPKLEMQISTIDLSVSGGKEKEEIRNWIQFRDNAKNCTFFVYDISGQAPDLRVWHFPSELFIKVLVSNQGRSPLTGVKLSLDHSSKDEWIGADSTPGLDIDVVNSGSNGFETHTVTVRNILPETWGVITLKLKEPQLKLKSTQAGTDEHLQFAGTGYTYKVIFLGSNELGNKGQFIETSALEMLDKESEMSGVTELRMPAPNIDLRELTGLSELNPSWRFRRDIINYTACQIPQNIVNKMMVGKFGYEIQAPVTGGEGSIKILPSIR